ncbi:CRISPR-associated endonuclease/helicase Cas3 [Paenibacillus algorifonticola]|uniref:CRISPR-associated endonuclease/helicase Cas3 n=1 Tax=Paenibacillus algorifonticola TaxID=684063 RepID=A0A1I2CMK5_9BACL|nr:CRISPR-associated helicase/endonuclease Cas3 [Paenibacillus algorifonticola]SFE69629.1 CRISPR-associated endonuclease/helicase Cas3 [Paenibacillus algorifonticola]
MEYIAHIRKKDEKIQTVKVHLEEVKDGCEQLGEKIGVRHLAGLAGWLHDLGKNTTLFMEYIQRAVAAQKTGDASQRPRKGSVDHSTAGGRLVYRRYHRKGAKDAEKMAAEWIANCIISHHQGLRDFIDSNKTSPFLKRVDENKEEVIERGYEQAKSTFFMWHSEKELDAYFAKAVEELEWLVAIIVKNELSMITCSLLIKYLFSCLIDADRTNSRQFEEEEEAKPTENFHSFFNRSYNALMRKFGELEQSKDAAKPINRLRREMSLQCDEFAIRPSGIYTLSIPTGGGKTLASLRYALKHALERDKQRIIYIVPYTTIIEQNAQEIRDILNENDMILEHHSNVIEEEDAPENVADAEAYDLHKKKIRLAKDTWDRPIIFTTMVQFLNTFYAKGTRNVRRLHQLSNAVIIFDEVQSVPVKCISLFNAALNFLHIFGRSSLLLCTATQPSLEKVKHRLHLSNENEIISNLDKVGKYFKRLEIKDRITSAGWKAKELADFVLDRMDKVDNILVIMNTKSAVRKLYKELKGRQKSSECDAKIFHLSTNMCAAHRKEVLDNLIEDLKPERKERVICISTQLIEAGVNISFQCVVRSLAGLDSIAQAAGRCNRHGEVAIRQVYIIKSADESLKKLKEIGIGAKQTQRVLDDMKEDPKLYGGELLSKAAMQAYFKYYYAHFEEDMNYRIEKLGGNKQMFDLLDSNLEYAEGYFDKSDEISELINYAALGTAEQHFEAISNSGRAVLVPYGEGKKLIKDLNGDLQAGKLGDLLRKLQPYVVNIQMEVLETLDKQGDISPLLNGEILALTERAYSKIFGVELDGENV